MNEQETKKIKGRLERALGSRLLDPTWERIKKSGMVRDYCQKDLPVVPLDFCKLMDR